MITKKAAMFYLIVFTLSTSGCGGGSGSGNADNTDPQILFDDNLSVETTAEATTEATTEVTIGTDTSDGIATPVASVSSAQMDAYVNNPLVKEIPIELNSASSNAVARRYITNPLIN